MVAFAPGWSKSAPRIEAHPAAKTPKRSTAEQKRAFSEDGTGSPVCEGEETSEGGGRSRVGRAARQAVARGDPNRWPGEDDSPSVDFSATALPPARQSLMAPASGILPAANAADLPVGATLAGKWRLDRVLGVGGCATVYAATHANGNRVAIKVLHAFAARDPELISRFLKEGHVGNLVDHPGIVRALDDGVTDDGRPYLVMELLDGETLEARLARDRALQAPEALRVIDLVLDALGAAHAAGLVHRDVKPANVFLTRAGSVKLLDFGIAHERVLGSRNETFMGLVLGTPAFMPPEQARGRWEEVGAPSDLWAVGATLFTALTGRLLHGGETPMEELVLATQPVGAIAALAREIDARLAAVLGRALAYRPEARFATAGDMQTALRMATPRPAHEIAAPIPSPRPGVARQTWAIAAAVALAGALTFALSGVRGAPSPSNVELPSPPSPAPSPTTTTAHAVASAAMEDVRPAPPPETVPPRRQRTALPTPAPSLRALVVPAPAPPRRDPLLEGRF